MEDVISETGKGTTMVDFTLLPGDPDFPTSSKRDLLPEDHWLRTERYIDADRMYRQREDVQPAIFAFSQAGGKFPLAFDRDNPEHYFVQKVERFTIDKVLRGGWEVTPKEKLQGWVDFPVVWSTADLCSAVSAYTDIHHEKGAGKKYDYHFSFFIKGLQPDWPCILTTIFPRGLFPSKENEGFEQKLLGLSPWEKMVKAKERELFLEMDSATMEEITFAIDRLLFMDSELDGAIHQIMYDFDPVQFGWGKELSEKFYPRKAFREKLVQAWESLGNRDERYGREHRNWSDFDMLLRDSYQHLFRLVKKGDLNEDGWREADDLIQKALCNEPYPKSGPAFSQVMKIHSSRSLLSVLEEFWTGTDSIELNRLAHRLRFLRG